MHVSKSSLLFAELAGKKTEPSTHSITSGGAGVFQSLLATIQTSESTTEVPSSETQAGQVFLEEIELSMKPDSDDSIQVVQSPDLLLEGETMDKEQGESRLEDIGSLREPELLHEEENKTSIPTTSIPLFATRMHFEGVEGKEVFQKIFSSFSDKKLADLARWGLPKSGELTPIPVDAPVKGVPVHAFDLVESPLLSELESSILLVEGNEMDTAVSEREVQTPELPQTGNQPVALAPLRGESASLSLSIPTIPVQLAGVPVDLVRPSFEQVDLSQPELEPFRTEFTKQMLSPLKQAFESTGQTLRIQVFPENLGHIDIIVTLHEGKLQAQLTTSSVLTRDVLDMQVPQLRQALLDQGIVIDQLEIEWSSGEDVHRDRPQEQQREGLASWNTSCHPNDQEEREEEDILTGETSQAVDYSV